jgi:hypothetical protein
MPASRPVLPPWPGEAAGCFPISERSKNSYSLPPGEALVWCKLRTVKPRGSVVSILFGRLCGGNRPQPGRGGPMFARPLTLVWRC